MAALSIVDVNKLSTEQFVKVFGNVIELCAESAQEVARKAPFASVDELCAAFNGYLDSLDEEGQVRVLRLHPDLAGRLAASTLTAESASEQLSAGLDRLTDDQKATMQASNERYKSKFGFPFIICARENKVESILKGLRSRLNNLKVQEIVTGINEVKKICKLRILDIVK